VLLFDVCWVWVGLGDWASGVGLLSWPIEIACNEGIGGGFSTYIPGRGPDN
jgi:hypothetical protein